MIKLPRIIGLSGKIHGGKTTIANALIERYPEYVRTAYADLLKQEASETYNFSLELCYSDEGKQTIITSDKLPRKQMSVREILQWHGTDYRRAQNENYWVDQMKKFLLSNDYVLVDDVRFDNELSLIQSVGGVVIRIDPYDQWVPGANADHISEVALDNCDLFDLRFTPESNKIKETIDFIEETLNINR